MLTRSQVAARLGRSLATVRRMEGVSLHPAVDERGVHRFGLEEVEHLANEIALCGRASPGPIRNHEPESELYVLQQRIDELEVQVEELRSEKADAETALAEFKESIRQRNAGIDQACALLVRQIDEPDAVTDLVIAALDRLLEA